MAATAGLEMDSKACQVPTITKLMTNHPTGTRQPIARTRRISCDNANPGRRVMPGLLQKSNRVQSESLVSLRAERWRSRHPTLWTGTQTAVRERERERN